MVHHILKALFAGIEMPVNASLMVIDLHGYDGAVPLMLLKDKPANLPLTSSCAILTHDEDARSYVTAIICQAIHECASKKLLALPSFPDIQAVLKTMVEPTRDSRSNLDLKATAYLPGKGCALVILDRILERWQADERRAAEFAKLVSAHNEEFNPQNVVYGKRAADDAVAETPAKRRITLIEDEVGTFDKLAHQMECPHEPVTCMTIS